MMSLLSFLAVFVLVPLPIILIIREQVSDAIRHRRH